MADGRAERTAGRPALTRLPGNSAKIRLLLDLRTLVPQEGAIRVLDVGCAGRYHPFELWEPLRPLASRIQLVGVDVANLEPTRCRAEELGFPFDLRLVSTHRLEREFGAGAFDLVVSTQMLEHVRDWRGALRQMAIVTRPGGRILVTCDSGDFARPPLERSRLVAKRAVARLCERAPAIGRAAERLVSGEWELGPTRTELRDAAEALGLRLERVAWYGIRDLKTAMTAAGPAARLLWLAVEEALGDDGAAARPELYRLLYLRARKP